MIGQSIPDYRKFVDEAPAYGRFEWWMLATPVLAVAAAAGTLPKVGPNPERLQVGSYVPVDIAGIVFLEEL